MLSATACRILSAGSPNVALYDLSSPVIWEVIAVDLHDQSIDQEGPYLGILLLSLGRFQELYYMFIGWRKRFFELLHSTAQRRYYVLFDLPALRILKCFNSYIK
jgi:hypothetical protein